MRGKSRISFPKKDPAMLEGLPPNRAAHVMRVSCDEASARRIADIIVETFDPAETAAAAFEQITNPVNGEGAPWIVEAYFGSAPDEANVRTLVAAAVGESAAEGLIFALIEDRDWIASSLEGLRPVRAGRFIVHGSHDRGKARANEIAIEIEAALAFGTGHHGSTFGCLILLDRLLRSRRPRKILDIGTGSGILAIAAAKVLKQKIRAGDIDPLSVAAARANARLNRVGAFLRPVLAKGAAHADLSHPNKFDFILANILARPLRLLAPKIASLAAPRADLVLSGLIPRDVPGVLSAYRAQGFALFARLEIDGWVSLHLRRAGRARKCEPDPRDA